MTFIRLSLLAVVLTLGYTAVHATALTSPGISAAPGTEIDLISKKKKKAKSKKPKPSEDGAPQQDME